MLHSELNLDHEHANHSPAEVWVWELMPPAQRRHRLRELANWVDWLRVTYTLHSSLPPCWYAHSLALQHLTALHVAWVDIYLGEPAQRALALVDWHEAMWRTIDRIHRHTPSTCLDGQHIEPHPLHGTTHTDDDLTAFTTGPWGTTPPRPLSTLHAPTDPETPQIKSGTSGVMT